jgi:hypothetical protein
MKRSDGTVPKLGIEISAAMRRKGARMRRRFARKYGYDPNRRYELFAEPHPRLTSELGVQSLTTNPAGAPIDVDNGVVIGTIQMGYGHYRIAMALASAARALGKTPYWMDLLAFDTPGARMIQDLEKWYARGSQLSQRSRLFNRLIWDPMMGKWYKRVDKNYPVMEACAVLSDIFHALPPNMPLVGTHPWNAQAAVHAGMHNVINVIPDNCPLGFHLVDGTRHTVQSPSAYFIFRTLRDMADGEGVPREAIAQVGHYVDHELVENIDHDCAARLRRLEDRSPRRILLSIGGAGAQQELLLGIVDHLLQHVRAGRVTLLINFGHHVDAWNLFRKRLPALENTAVRHFEWEDTRAFCNNAVDAAVEGTHVFLHEDTASAVYATNLLMRASDLLITKPSELAYYPIPKLFIERVGGHEAWGAIRGAELGDGTTECTGMAFTRQALDLLIEEDDLLRMYCENIQELKTTGMYDGAYKVIRMACESD